MSLTPSDVLGQAQSPGLSLGFDGSIIYLSTKQNTYECYSQKYLANSVNNIQVICDQGSDSELHVLCMPDVLHYGHCHLLLIVIDNAYFTCSQNIKQCNIVT
jgi:hypothetical protein